MTVPSPYEQLKDDLGYLQRADTINFNIGGAGVHTINLASALPNITDGYSGKAPDLGAYEYGQPEPHYGPRPTAEGR